MAEIKGSFYGTTREDEEKKYSEIKRIAEDKLEIAKGSVQALKAELHELKEVYDVEDKEGLAQWFNTDARFGEVRRDLLRAERATKKPYFGRIDFEDNSVGKRETYYIGKTIISQNPNEPIVIDWRAPIASIYYDHSLGLCRYKVPREGFLQVDLKRKRTYELSENSLKDYYDSDVVANDELLTKYLSKSRRAVLSEIIATIQQEQNNVIRKNPRHNVVIQGSAGSGKTTVAMHRISYILYNYELEFKPESFYIVGSNKVLLDYITGVLPDLDVYGVRQMTMEGLFERLLYEDLPDSLKIRKLEKTDRTVGLKGCTEWFDKIENFCRDFEKSYIPMEDIRIEKNSHIILKKSEIEETLRTYPTWSMKEKFDRLTDLLMSHLETELYGRYYSYNVEEQKKLTKHYQNYFKRLYLKTSSVELYEDFIRGEQSKNPELVYISNEPDMYDLAGMAYIYKRLKETEVIQEASHVIIDEAQDFGIMIYRALKYCMSKCTFTIMGDVAQNINLNTGLTDWEELKTVMLPHKFDYFGLLRKSYRNTVEISNYATDILRHANFPIYPVEPVLRHGETVREVKCNDFEELVEKVCERTLEYQKDGYETIAIICKDDAETGRVYEKLSKKLKVSSFSEDNTVFKGGVMVLPIEYAKGLEFDAVIVFDASETNYPKEDGYARLLYVAATRALHELTVFYSEKLTKLISDPIPKERMEISFAEDDFHELPYEFEEEFETVEEEAKRIAKEGDAELKLREKYGPKRIVVNKKSPEEPKLSSKIVVNTQPAERVMLTKPSAVRRNSAVTEDYSAFNRLVNKEEEIPKMPVKAQTQEKKLRSVFGRSPEGTSLQPAGHGRIDTSVRWTKADKSKVDIITGYCTVRIEPVTDETVFVAIIKDGNFSRGAHPSEIEVKNPPKWTCAESREEVNIKLPKMTVKIDKKKGTMSFVNSNGVTFLTERDATQRQFHELKNTWWEFFEWGKKETLTAQGEESYDWLDLTSSAKYVSFCDGKGRTGLVTSNKGYQLLFPAELKTLICTIPAYGPYLMFEDTKQISYYVRVAR